MEASGSEIKNLWIDLFNFFNLSKCHTEECETIQIEPKLEEGIFLYHIESKRLSFLPAVERMQKQFTALVANSVANSDSNIAKNDG